MMLNAIDVELLDAGSRIEEKVEYGVRWHNGAPGGNRPEDLHYIPGGAIDRWYDSRETARIRADRFPQSLADDEDPMWGEMICRTVITIIGPTEKV
jgi:hypothetical protein